MKIEEVDPLLTALSEKFRVAKPNYCIFRVVPIKKLDPISENESYKQYIKGGGHTLAAEYGGQFHHFERFSCISYMVRRKGQIRRETVVHEFFHYFLWFWGRALLKPAPSIDVNELIWKTLNDKPTKHELNDVLIYLADIHEDEILVRKLTRMWLRRQPFPKTTVLKLIAACHTWAKKYKNRLKELNEGEENDVNT